ncbi:MAG TPA: right-handed parallel beta-helix repeat-containing protein [Candidatus Hydrogenedentes bacterium]|nr:right-handed parallel beta-helix repeat-containing protein [Candidatus Hydrogenedentota bacterium]HQM50375.1 right-handed parallel beta-helix repeat-containing protein [Candidatus Hydrogenedentota bacterium]
MRWSAVGVVVAVAASLAFVKATFAENAPAATFYVSTQGKDSWPGTSAAPLPDGSNGSFATLEAARDAARQLGADVPRRLVVAGGSYFLTQALLLDQRDNGLTIEAEAGTQPILYGGTRIEGWQPDGDRFWAAPISAVADGPWDFRMLSVNGRFCKRARLPREGAFEHLTAFDVPWMSTTGGGWKRKPTDQELTTMQYRPEDLGPWFDVKNAELTIYHMWDESLVGVARMDTDTSTLTFSTPAEHPPGAFGVKRYTVWNLREGMTEPGQWYLDRTAGKVVYWPLPEEDMASAVVIAPRTAVLLRIKGADDNLARGITIRGLGLSVTNTPLKAGGFGALRFEGALTAAQAADCVFADLEIFNAGGYGLKTWKLDTSRVERCHVHHCGAGGIAAEGVEGIVADNRIHDVGLAYPSALGLRCGGANLQIIHNEIHDTPYTGICGGGKGLVIASNRIYRVMRELHDGAAIYVGFCKDITLRGNYACDIEDTGGYGASAYYLDEQAENCLVEGNVSVNVARPSHNHMAVNNTIRHNVFVTQGAAQITLQKSSEYTIEGNIVRAGGDITITNVDGVKMFRNNVLFSGTGKVNWHIMENYKSTGERPIEAANGNILGDPLLLDCAGGTIRLDPASPALALGFPPVDVSNAGPRTATAP